MRPSYADSGGLRAAWSSRKVLLKCVSNGMSSPSSHTIGPPESLPCSCQRHAGVMTKSPGSMITFSPSTVVWAPLPSMMKRSADCVWRCGGATSPGMMSCSPAKSVFVTWEVPRSPGFSRISTRRSASRAEMWSADSSRNGRASA